MLRQLTFTGYRVQEINAAESSSHQRVHLVTGAFKTQSGARADMWEDVALAKLNKCQLGVVAMSQEICSRFSMLLKSVKGKSDAIRTLQAVKTGAHES